ncbi:MAG: serine hydrolase domain-containing protein, partial [Pseudomonadota bacterium]|nr:serine hydrolase domain-containing protein [Pseudomonadota bacterium]
MKSDLEATMQANNVPFASFGVTDARATRMHAHIGSVGDVALDDTHIFRIASMTKPIVTLAALQLVAGGDLRLDQPMKEILPVLGEVQVVSRTGDELVFAPLARDITLHHLLTHTSGYAYDFHAEMIAELVAQEKIAGLASDNDAFLAAPLIFQPGENWEYGINIDWAGKIVEKVSGVDLNEYVKANILRPLGMKNTSFSINDLSADALVPLSLRDDDGNLSDVSELMPNVTDGPYLGGGGLYSNVGDYMKFMRMVLQNGQGPDSEILPSGMVRDMFANQIGDLQVGYMPSQNPMLAKSHGWFEDNSMKWGYGFMVN